MSLAFDAVKHSLLFLKRYPVSLLFALIISLVFTLSSVSSSLFSATSAFSLQFISIVVAMGIVSFIISIIQSGGFPVIVIDSLKKRKSVLANAFKKPLSRIGGLFIVTIIVSLITLLPFVPVIALGVSILPSLLSSQSSIPGINLPDLESLGLSLGSLGIVGVLFIAGLVASFYLSARLWLVFPIFMIEGKRVIDSIKSSWNLSKGKVLSIWLAMILLLVLVLVPGIIISILVGILSIGTLNVLWGIIYSVFVTAFAGVLSTAYYLKVKKAWKLR